MNFLQSLTAKSAMTAKEKKSLTAKAAVDAKIFEPTPREKREDNAKHGMPAQTVDWARL